MSESVHTNASLYSKGMMAVICAQFLSAFGDNALLFATLALMKQLYYPEWSQPVLQMLFVGAYILFAPFVGQFADSFAKGRVMMAANGLKLLGAGCICFGVNPFIGYTLVGVGAAAYSPAKYGILGELTTGDKLVKANGLMESSTIAAILLGSMAGGILADWHVLAALIVCALVYGGAVVANLWIPRLPAARPGQSWRFRPMTHSFFSACKTLWRNSAALPAGDLGARGAWDHQQRDADLPQCDGRRRDCGWRWRGGEAGNAGNRLALYARRDIDWRRGDCLRGAAVAIACIWPAATARCVRRLLYCAAERAAAGTRETYRWGR